MAEGVRHFQGIDVAAAEADAFDDFRGAELVVARSASTPLPMLAPMTRPSATVSGMIAELARVA